MHLTGRGKMVDTFSTYDFMVVRCFSQNWFTGSGNGVSAKLFVCSDDAALAKLGGLGDRRLLTVASCPITLSLLPCRRPLREILDKDPLESFGVFDSRFLQKDTLGLLEIALNHEVLNESKGSCCRERDHTCY